MSTTDNNETKLNSETTFEDPFLIADTENMDTDFKDSTERSYESSTESYEQYEDQPLIRRANEQSTKCCKFYDKLNRAFQKIEVKMIPFFISIIIFLVVLLIPVLKDHPEAHRCLAILLFAASLWATETFPLFVTALLVPIPVVWFKVLLDDDNKPMSAGEASSQITYRFFDPVVLLFLGGFCIAQALHKYNLSERLANIILRKAGTKPKKILFLTMLLGLILSMWISNVASTVVCISVLLPLIRNNIPDGDPFQKALLLGIAYSNNVGGMTTPIASPQNAIAVKVSNQISDNNEPIGFFQWIVIAFPTAFLVMLFTYLFLLKFYRTRLKAVEQVIYTPQRLTYKHWIVIVTTIVTVLLWCLNSLIDDFVGDLGITAIIPVIVFFGTGILSKKDLGKLSWPVLLLMGGGLALGYAVQQSGLLHLIANGISDIVGDSILLWVISAFAVLMIFASTLISSTVAAVIVLPIVGAIGDSHHHLRLMLVLVDLMTSGGNCLPISSFPNATTFAVSNDKGNQYVKTKDYLVVGFFVTVLTYLGMISSSYGIATLFKY
ncbi:low-affinity phosphate transporter pho91 [Anaeramoeba ignava]|uniref:Low-affinity phosphate transporter pho91 n=1 Tax=Anaeramoeba ignava TaxID=1746090 RepID=A0A9Q0LCE6_ANAIG|nr:low-affinity phosphate transporter pho91 [Anaeramoeba ignava]